MFVAGRPDKTLTKHANAREPYLEWEQSVLLARWHRFLEVRQSRPDVDRLGDCFIFNIGGNKFRLIAKIRYASEEHPGFVTVRALLTHSEYDRGAWKGDC